VCLSKRQAKRLRPTYLPQLRRGSLSNAFRVLVELIHLVTRELHDNQAFPYLKLVERKPGPKNILSVVRHRRHAPAPRCRATSADVESRPVIPRVFCSRESGTDFHSRLRCYLAAERSTFDRSYLVAAVKAAASTHLGVADALAQGCLA
jgi:hypothetical protein